MDRRQCLGLIAAAPAALAAPALAQGTRPGAYADAAYRAAIVIDGLGGVSDPVQSDARRMSPRGAAELVQSGLTAVQQTVGDVGNAPDVWDKTLRSIAEFDGIIEANRDLFTHATRAADIRAAKAAGRCAIIYGTQDTAMVGADLDRLGVLSGLGVRVVQLTYNLRNLSGDGAIEAADAGLSRLGHHTIERIEAEKLLLDLSHGGARTIAEGIAAAKRPPTISHTGCRALNDNPRNVADASLRALADKGGVVGIYWMPFLVASGHPMRADLIAHLDHAMNVCGEDHVAIGTDGILSTVIVDDAARAAQRQAYEDRHARGIDAPGEGPDVFTFIPDLNTHMRFRTLADALSTSGWPAARIDKVLGANLMRLYAETWGD